jgi:hypothetical protein
VVELRDTATDKLFLLSSLQSIKLLIINIRAEAYEAQNSDCCSFIITEPGR